MPAILCSIRNPVPLPRFILPLIGTTRTGRGVGRDWLATGWAQLSAEAGPAQPVQTNVALEVRKRPPANRATGLRRGHQRRIFPNVAGDREGIARTVVRLVSGEMPLDSLVSIRAFDRNVVAVRHVPAPFGRRCC